MGNVGDPPKDVYMDICIKDESTAVKKIKKSLLNYVSVNSNWVHPPGNPGD